MTALNPHSRGDINLWVRAGALLTKPPRAKKIALRAKDTLVIKAHIIIFKGEGKLAGGGVSP